MALIDVGNHTIMRAHQGDYIGKDHGVIKEITVDKILIDEKFSAPTEKNPEGWVVVPNEIQLKTRCHSSIAVSS